VQNVLVFNRTVFVCVIIFCLCVWKGGGQEEKRRREREKRVSTYTSENKTVAHNLSFLTHTPQTFVSSKTQQSDTHLIMLVNRCTLSNQTLHRGNITFEGGLTHQWHKLVLRRLQCEFITVGILSRIGFIEVDNCVVPLREIPSSHVLYPWLYFDRIATAFTPWLQLAILRIGPSSPCQDLKPDFALKPLDKCVSRSKNVPFP